MCKITVTFAPPAEPEVETISLELSVDQAAYVHACLAVQASWKIMDDGDSLLFDRLDRVLTEVGADGLRDTYLRRVKDDLLERVREGGCEYLTA